MLTCSVIIPAYNHAPLTRDCLEAVFATLPERFETEVIVVDDNSRDATPQLLAQYGDRIRTIRHEQNRGFATSCNEGAAVAAGEYLVFLNNDTLPRAGWLDALARYAEDHPRAAVVGSKLLFPNDTIQHAGVIISQSREPRHIYIGFPADHPAVNVSRRFQIVTAACALFRRVPFEQLGGFDSGFINSYEDVDLCLRLGERGYEVHYCHKSVLYHFESVSAGRHAHDSRNLERYHDRWAARVQPDDLKYYIEDGLLTLDYSQYPFLRFGVSPLLGTVVDPQARDTDRLLDRRAREAWGLMKENTRLKVEIRNRDFGEDTKGHL